MHEDARVTDALTIALHRARDLAGDRVGLVGYGVAVLRRGGLVVATRRFANLITTAGDEYYAKKAIVGIAPANAAAPTAASGMKLGTGTAAATKSGAAAALGAYIAGSNNPFDATYPQAAAVAADGGWNATYRTTWPAGDATNTAITEVVLVNDSATDATSAAAATYARATFTAVNKAAGDSLEITWTHKFLGA